MYSAIPVLAMTFFKALKALRAGKALEVFEAFKASVVLRTACFLPLTIVKKKVIELKTT